MSLDGTKVAVSQPWPPYFSSHSGWNIWEMWNELQCLWLYLPKPELKPPETEADVVCAVHALLHLKGCKQQAAGKMNTFLSQASCCKHFYSSICNCPQFMRQVKIWAPSNFIFLRKNPFRSVLHLASLLMDIYEAPRSLECICWRFFQRCNPWLIW